MRRTLWSTASILIPLLSTGGGSPVLASTWSRENETSRLLVKGPAYYHPSSGPAVGVAYQWGYPYPYPYYVDSSLRLDVKPRDAKVYVDGYYAGIVDDFDGALQRLHVTPGQHEITIWKEGFRSIHEKLYLAPDSSRKLTHVMEALPAGEPNEPEPTPVMQPPPPPQYQEPPDQQNPPDQNPPDQQNPPARGARRGAPPRRNPGPPEQPPQAESGTVIVRVEPEDAELYVDGERWVGRTDDDRLVLQLVEGLHKVEVRKDGYRTVTLDVQVRRGETAPVNVSLTRQ